ncbi:hypothetical protein CHS0354_002059 [Potamilus streckersoni]|uniref:Naphthoate synthase n=1 Tax=Potamilus streckersoni TaxID=2493646 RepID=A0AAE0T5R6_9BIVA|nr:hypothetical protein CHS0354_002059 [Potamilus streckersoni]
MIDAMLICREDSRVKTVILTGEGDKAFCSGGDQNYKTPAVTKIRTQLIRSLPKAVVAMVNGYAIGGGHVLHVVCDLTIASDNAIFGQTGPKVGSFDGGFWFILSGKIVGQKKAREIWFLCRQYSAKEALEMGLWCREIMEKSHTAIRMLKMCFNAELDGQAGLQELAGNATLLYYLTEEAQEGKKAFLEKRKPDFKQYPSFP